MGDEIRKVSRDAGAGEARYDPAQETELQRKQRHKMDMDAGLRHRGDPVPAREEAPSAKTRLTKYPYKTEKELAQEDAGEEPPTAGGSVGDALAVLFRLPDEASITCTDAYREELIAALSVLAKDAPALHGVVVPGVHEPPPLQTENERKAWSAGYRDGRKYGEAAAPAKPVATACGQSDDFDEGYRQGLISGEKMGRHAQACEDDRIFGALTREDYYRKQREIGDRQLQKADPLPSWAVGQPATGPGGAASAPAEDVEALARCFDKLRKDHDEHVVEYAMFAGRNQTLAQRAMNAAAAASDGVAQAEMRVDGLKRSVDRLRTEVGGATGRAETAVEVAREARRIASNPGPPANIAKVKEKEE